MWNCGFMAVVSASVKTIAMRELLVEETRTVSPNVDIDVVRSRQPSFFKEVNSQCLSQVPWKLSWLLKS